MKKYNPKNTEHIIHLAKKEVFDDMEKNIIEKVMLTKMILVKAFNYTLYKQLKKRHLSTSQKAKEHNRNLTENLGDSSKSKS